MPALTVEQRSAFWSLCRSCFRSESKTLELVHLLNDYRHGVISAGQCFETSSRILLPYPAVHKAFQAFSQQQWYSLLTQSVLLPLGRCYRGVRIQDYSSV